MENRPRLTIELEPKVFSFTARARDFAAQERLFDLRGFCEGEKPTILGIVIHGLDLFPSEILLKLASNSFDFGKFRHFASIPLAPCITIPSIDSNAGRHYSAVMPSLQYGSPRTKTVLLVFIFVGVLAKFYLLNAPWARKDHYNFGGVNNMFMTGCFKKIPLAESKGVVMWRCEDGKPIEYYTNHPPLLIFEMAAWTSALGTSETSPSGVHGEWAYRLFGVLFSILNLYLVFRLAHQWRPDDEIFPYWAAAFHALFLFTLYFGSHIDFISEFAMTPILLSWIAMFKERSSRAGLATIWGGLSAWSGFLNFGGLFGYQIVRRKNPLVVMIWGALGFAAGLALMMWLKQTTSIWEFVQMKLSKPGYVAEHDWMYPFKWLANAVQMNSRYISPAFLLIIAVELARATWTREKLARTVLVAGGGVIYLLLGRDLFYIHDFLYIYLVPFYSLTAAEAMLRMQTQNPGALSRRLKIFAGVAVFLFLAFYPYGVIKTNMVHDVINSLGLLTTAIFAAVWTFRGENSTRRWLVLVGAVGVVNISQMINYRNQPWLDYEFCNKAREEHARTGQPVPAPPGLDKFFTRDLYCRGIPLIEPAE